MRVAWANAVSIFGRIIYTEVGGECVVVGVRESGKAKRSVILSVGRREEGGHGCLWERKDMTSAKQGQIQKELALC